MRKFKVVIEGSTTERNLYALHLTETTGVEVEKIRTLNEYYDSWVRTSIVVKSELSPVVIKSIMISEAVKLGVRIIKL